MVNFTGMTELQSVESYIEGLLDSSNNYPDEQSLSDAFDENIAPLVIEQYGEDDEPAMNEAFNDWTDSECKEGNLHTCQYNNYCYVGEWS